MHTKKKRLSSQRDHGTLRGGHLLCFFFRFKPAERGHCQQGIRGDILTKVPKEMPPFSLFFQKD